ncbi:MAG: hypothetical protein IJ489_06100 [Clostridia bacterium]|nr:hypothetical protein [Clostridia bacterium]
MKKALPKILIFFYLIPWALSFLLIGLDVLFNAMYLEWLWIPDWCMVVPYMAGYYLSNFAVFIVCGIFTYYIFFEKAWKAALISVFSLLYVMFVPYSQFLLQKTALQDILYDVGLLDYYYEFNTSLMFFLMNTALFLLAALLIRAAYALFLMKKPKDTTARIFSPRHPVGLVSLIFFASKFVMGAVIFIGNGVFTGEAFLNLGIEYLLNILFFVCTVLTASAAAKWNAIGSAAPNPALR